MRRPRPTRILSWVCAALIIVLAFAQGAAAAELTPLATYTSQEGITVISYSQAWVEQGKLRAVVDELLRNLHGPELGLLSYIEIFPGKEPQTLGSYYFGFQQAAGGTWEIMPGRKIHIYEGDTRTTIEDIARTLAHEYGHHFTIYHIWTGEGKRFQEDWRTTGYYRARRFEYFPQVGVGGDHRWDPLEIAAEDYVQLFGSPTARKSEKVQNLLDYWEAYVEQRFPWEPEKVNRWGRVPFNVMPQENWDLPLASEIPGLREYWLRLSGLQYPVSAPPSRPLLTLQKVEPMPRTTDQLHFSWEAAADDGPGSVEYTAVRYGEDGSYSVLQTRSDGEPLRTRFGGGYETMGNYAYWFTWMDFTGKSTFVVYAKDSDNNIVASNRLAVDLSDPRPTTEDDALADFDQPWLKPIAPDFTDLSPRHWAYHAVMPLVDAGVITGYPDYTYRPERAVTRAEFLALTIRAMPHLARRPGWEAPAGPSLDHWAGEMFAVMASNGVITEDDYGPAFSKFILDDPISREEAAMILVRAAGLDVQSGERPAFADSADTRYGAEVASAARAGLITGFPDGTFRPSDSLTRAQAAAIIARLKEYLPRTALQ